MDAAIAALVALPLASWTDPPTVFKQKLPDLATAVYPCAFVTIKDCKQTLVPFTTETDDRTLPVACHLMDRESSQDASTLSPWLLWLEQMTSAFLMQIFDALSEGPIPGTNWHVEIRTMDVLDAQRSAGPGYQHAVSSFWLDCRVTTARVRPA
jgi:hypothetical protein